MDEYKFSVLMSVYAKEQPEFLRAALQSNLEEQTLLPDEMVLICDGPLTDELDDVIGQFQVRHPKVLRVFRLQENGGLGKALDYGLQQCRFDWVARSDSDDICDSRRFETQIAYLREHPEIDILGSHIDEFESDWEAPARTKRMPLTDTGIKAMAKTRNPINHTTVIFRKSVVLAVGSYQHLPYMEDYFLWVRAICGGAKLANIDQYLVHVRVGNGMVGRRGNRAQIASRRKLNEYMLQNGLIGRLGAAKNLVCIAAFTGCPDWARKLLYDTLLRTKTR